MKYAPGLPPPMSGVKNRREVQTLTALKAVKPVQPHGAHQEAAAGLAPEVAAESIREKERRDPTQEPRRRYCRRVSPQPLLEELRSGLARRRCQQRVSDATDHIDEKA